MIRERERTGANGFLMFVLFATGMVVFTIWGAQDLGNHKPWEGQGWILLTVLCAVGLGGLFTVNPNEAKVLQLFGHYVGSVRTPGLRWASPFFTKRKVSQRVRNFESAKLKVNDL